FLEARAAMAVDEGLVASLEAEAAGLESSQAATETEAAALIPALEDLVRRESDLAAAKAGLPASPAPGPDSASPALGDDLAGGVDRALGDDLAGGVDRGDPARRLAGVRSRLSLLFHGISRDDAELARMEHRAVEASERLQALARQAEEEERKRSVAEGTTRALAASAEQASSAFRASENGQRLAEESLRSTELERGASAARVEALSLALAEARDQAGAARLVDMDGVLGSLSDVVAVDSGWEAAFSAAAGEALRSMVVRDLPAARAAAAQLDAGDSRGALLPARPVTATPVYGSGAMHLQHRSAPVDDIGTRHGPGDGAVVTLADGSQVTTVLLRRHVRSLAPGVDGLLDAILSDAVVVPGDWQQALAAHLASPSLVVLTRRGDRLSASGWRIGADRPDVTAGALADAQSRAKEADQVADQARAACGRGRASTAVHRGRLSDAQAELTRATAEERAALDHIERLGDRRRAAESELAELAGDEVALRTRLAGDREEAAALSESLPGLEDAATRAEAAIVQAREARSRAEAEVALRRRELEGRASALATLRRDLEVRAAGLEERRKMQASRRSEIEGRLQRLAREREEAGERRVDLAAQVAASAGLADRARAATERAARLSEQLAGFAAEREAAMRDVGERMTS
ncbi:MAG: hypothetical protein ACRDYD_14480, partial [Acidimicrobiales bacterium]